MTHKLFFYAPNLATSNANTDFFRVTSLFGDPSLYGRHVVLGIGVGLSLLVAGRWRTWPLIGLIAVMWAGLLFSYSQSSMAALLVVMLALGGASRATGACAWPSACSRWPPRWPRPAFVAYELIDGESINHITSDRTKRVEDTARVIRHNPVVGRGDRGPAARQPRAGRQRPPDAELRLAHHAADRGGGARRGRARAVRVAAGRRRAPDRVGAAARAGARAWRWRASFLALFVHALFYSGFLEDPITWLVLAVAAGWLAWQRGSAIGRGARRRAGGRRRMSERARPAAAPGR